MQQKDDGGAFRPRFSVENGESIDLHGAIEHLLFHCFVLFWATRPSAASTANRRAQASDKHSEWHPLVYIRNLEDDLELYGHPKGKARNADHQPNRIFSMPKTSRNKSETASATLGWSKKSPCVAMNTPSLTTRVTRSSEPRCFLAAARTPKAAV